MKLACTWWGEQKKIFRSPGPRFVFFNVRNITCRPEQKERHIRVCTNLRFCMRRCLANRFKTIQWDNPLCWIFGAETLGFLSNLCTLVHCGTMLYKQETFLRKWGKSVFLSLFSWATYNDKSQALTPRGKLCAMSNFKVFAHNGYQVLGVYRSA